MGNLLAPVAPFNPNVDTTTESAASNGEVEETSHAGTRHTMLLQNHIALDSESHRTASTRPDDSITLAEFVKCKFVPECVAPRRLAGRTHFQFILRHVLTPEEVARAFGLSAAARAPRCQSVSDWPYLGSRPLQHIDYDAIEILTSTALKAGYSTQTVVHIRNVIRSIFVHAIKTRCFMGENPASLVRFPVVVRKTSHWLTMSELRQAMQLMRFPERHIALFTILTDMNVSEICGLQWGCVNLASYPRELETEMLPPRTIAVRSQSYRGEFSTVTESRRRFLPIPNLLLSALNDLKRRDKFSDRCDFVFASRKGTPINPENVGTRRLKAVGRILDIPWLSWSALRRTRLDLKSRLGPRMNRELEQILI